jgi:NADH-quinone oxidoreductase subunit H
VVLAAVLTTGHLRLEQMVDAQRAAVGPLSAASWTVLYQPLAALIFFVTALAESNRLPFDLAECEQELIGGYHTEYSAMKLAMFFLAEYAHMITASAFMIAMFFGGYLVPGWRWLNEDQSAWAMAARIAAYSVKVALVICLYMIVRWTLPRLRFDQLMRLAWKSLVPMGLGLVAVQAVVIYAGCSQWWSLAGNIAVLVAAAVAGAVRHAPVTGRQASLGA